MPRISHAVAAACAAASVLAATAAGGALAQGGSAQPSQAGEAKIPMLDRHAQRFERAIEGHLQKVARREARREARRQERLAAEREARDARRADVGVDSSILASIAACESGGDPAAVNPAGYYGKYQFDLGTWQSVGGSGNPAEASESEQDYRAALLYSRAGASPWPVCAG